LFNPNRLSLLYRFLVNKVPETEMLDTEFAYLVRRTWNLKGLSILYSFPPTGRDVADAAAEEAEAGGRPLGLTIEEVEGGAMEEASGVNFPLTMSSQGNGDFTDAAESCCGNEKLICGQTREQSMAQRRGISQVI
jgi:hypothetical protein